MYQFWQGDIIKIDDYKKQLFVVVSKNAFIRATGIMHVCPLINCPPGPVHIFVTGNKGASGSVICEQIKAIDPAARACSTLDRLPYRDIMNVSDTLQGIFEYD